MRRDRYEELVRFDSAGMAASPVMGLHDLARLPKAHLHLHFDGALRRETFEELAVAAGCPAPMPTSYGSFADFEQTIAAVASVLRTRADVARVVNEIAEDALCEAAVWLELSVWPGLFKGQFGSEADALDVLLDAVAAASQRCKIGIGVIVAANRDRGPADACAVARLAASRSGSGVVGFGLDGDEATHPAALFVEAFGTARGVHKRNLPASGGFGPDGDHRGVGRITPNNSEVDRGDQSHPPSPSCVLRTDNSARVRDGYSR